MHRVRREYFIFLFVPEIEKKRNHLSESTWEKGFIHKFRTVMINQNQTGSVAYHYILNSLCTSDEHFTAACLLPNRLQMNNPERRANSQTIQKLMKREPTEHKVKKQLKRPHSFTALRARTQRDGPTWQRTGKRWSEKVCKKKHCRPKLSMHNLRILLWY